MSLDEDARRLRGEPDAPALGELGVVEDREPNYASAWEGAEGLRDAPRVARVETIQKDIQEPRRVDEPGLTAAATEGFVSSEGRDSGPRDLGPQLAGEGDKDILVTPDRGVDPMVGIDDTTELIPAELDRMGRVELLLTQALEENRLLKRRLDQAESRSHSSWHSGQGQQDPPCTPASFGPRSGMDVQTFLASEFPGQPQLGLGEEELVRSLRILLVFAVAQAVRDQGEEEAGASCSEGEDPGSQVFLALDSAIFEGPPVDGLGVLRGELFKPLYGLNVASFDQGCCGASGVRATSLVTSSWFLYETLHEMRVSEGVRSLWASFQGGQEATSDDWTGGLLRIIQNAWVLWKWERAKQEEVRERKAILKKLTEEEAYALHVKNDHVPYRKGCPICISAQGRQRSHWRSGFPGVHSLSVDIAGPLIPGRSWDVEASGRDKGGGYRYFLACAYTIPGEFAPGSGRDESKDDDYAPSECGHMVSDKPSKGTVDTPGALDSSGEQDLFQELDAIPLSLEEAVDREEDLKETAGQLRQAEIVCDWLEQGLVNWDEGILVGALQVEVPIGSEGTSDQFLQTRTVGLAEARKELPKWVEPAREEVTSLEATNRAVDRVKASDVDAWANEGVNIVQLPGKVVLTRKSGTGKRRCRAVCCGNYLPTEKLGLTREDLYASGAEALSDKLALIFAARFPLWVGIIVDVKSAFLYAPIRSDYEGAEERIIVKPPGFLVELGLLDREDRWWIRKALYGLPTSPRDWGRYRDQEFKKFVITSEGVTHHLVQTKSDDALWFARVFKDGCLGDVAGILIVYVDDLAFLGPPELCKQFVAAIRANWKTSEPEWIGKVPVTFCGIELSRGDTGYRMTQRSYIQELLNRYGVEEEAGVPITKWVEPEHPEAATVDQVADTFSDHSLLPLPRADRVLELFTDASHSPNGDRSMQAVFIVWRGVPVAWESTRQAFTTLSSAESELVCMVHGLQLAEAVQPLVDELVEQDSLISLLADNEAAIRAFEASPAGWRNRHLRMRAHAGRERIAANVRKVSH
eukprot:s2446_g8.t1